MSSDLSIFHLILQASFVVQLVMLILLVASVVSWTFIFTKRKELNAAIVVTDDFEDIFWSGINLAELYKKLYPLKGIPILFNLSTLPFRDSLGIVMFIFPFKV